MKPIFLFCFVLFCFAKPLDLPYLFSFLREILYFLILIRDSCLMKENAIEKDGENAVSNRFSTFIS